jgi:hypothetical protein
MGREGELITECRKEDDRLWRERGGGRRERRIRGKGEGERCKRGKRSAGAISLRGGK